jgi:hypothetical protein
LATVAAASGVQEGAKSGGLNAGTTATLVNAVQSNGVAASAPTVVSKPVASAK